MRFFLDFLRFGGGGGVCARNPYFHTHRCWLGHPIRLGVDWQSQRWKVSDTFKILGRTMTEEGERSWFIILKHASVFLTIHLHRSYTHTYFKNMCEVSMSVSSSHRRRLSTVRIPCVSTALQPSISAFSPRSLLLLSSLFLLVLRGRAQRPHHS